MELETILLSVSGLLAISVTNQIFLLRKISNMRTQQELDHMEIRALQIEGESKERFIDRLKIQVSDLRSDNELLRKKLKPCKPNNPPRNQQSYSKPYNKATGSPSKKVNNTTEPVISNVSSHATASAVLATTSTVIIAESICSPTEYIPTEEYKGGGGTFDGAGASGSYDDSSSSSSSYSSSSDSSSSYSSSDSSSSCSSSGSDW